MFEEVRRKLYSQVNIIDTLSQIFSYETLNHLTNLLFCFDYLLCHIDTHICPLHSNGGYLRKTDPCHRIYIVSIFH